MTSQRNIEIVQNLYRAFGAGDGPGIFSALAPDVDWKFNGRPSDVPYAGHFHNVQELQGFFGTVAQTAEVLEFSPREITAFEDKVVVLGSEKVRAKSTRKIFETDWIHFFTITADGIVRLREYYDTAAMAEAYRAE